jgi:hypothetical protein
MTDIVDRLRKISIAPPREAGLFDEWLEQEDAFALLKENLSEGEFFLYVGLPFTFIYTIAVPHRTLDPLDVDDLLSWSGNPWSSWNIWYSFGERGEIGINPPLENICSKVLAGGEQLIFGRRFDG